MGRNEQDVCNRIVTLLEERSGPARAGKSGQMRHAVVCLIGERFHRNVQGVCSTRIP